MYLCKRSQSRLEGCHWWRCLFERIVKFSGMNLFEFTIASPRYIISAHIIERIIFTLTISCTCSKPVNLLWFDYVYQRCTIITLKSGVRLTLSYTHVQILHNFFLQQSKTCSFSWIINWRSSYSCVIDFCKT